MRAYQLSLVAALSGWMVGCSSAPPAGTFGVANTTTGGAPYVEQSADQGQRPVVSPVYGQPAMAPGGQSVASKLWNNPVTNSITDAISSVPQVVPAAVTGVADPLKLSNEPNPKPDLFVSLGRVAEQHGNLLKARENYQRALEIEPTSVNALLAYAHLEDRQGRLIEAVKLYEAAVASDPNNPAALNDLGLCYARQGQLDRSIPMLQRAIQTRPRDKRYRNNLARVYVELDRNEEAIAELTPVLGPAHAHYNVAFMLQQRGETDQAVTHFSQALRLKPSMSQAKAWLAKLQSPAVGNPASAVAASQPSNVTAAGQQNVSGAVPQFAPSRVMPVARPVPSEVPSAAQQTPVVSPRTTQRIAPVSQMPTVIGPAAASPYGTVPNKPSVPLYPGAPSRRAAVPSTTAVAPAQPRPAAAQSYPTSSPAASYPQPVPRIEQQFGRSGAMQSPPVPRQQPVGPALFPATPAASSPARAPYPSPIGGAYPAAPNIYQGSSTVYPSLQMPGHLPRTDLTQRGDQPPTPVVLTNTHVVSPGPDRQVQPAAIR